MALANEDLTYGIAANANSNEVRRVRHINSIARERGTIDGDGDLRQRRLLIDVERHILGAGHGLEHIDDVSSNTTHFIEIFAEDPHYELAVHVKNTIHNALDDRLADVDIVTGQVAETLGQPTHHIARAPAVRPGARKLQQDIALDVRWRPWVEALVVAAKLRDDRLDFRKLTHDLAEVRRHLGC